MPEFHRGENLFASELAKETKKEIPEETQRKLQTLERRLKNNPDLSSPAVQNMTELQIQDLYPAAIEMQSDTETWVNLNDDQRDLVEKIIVLYEQSHTDSEGENGLAA